MRIARINTMDMRNGKMNERQGTYKASICMNLLFEVLLNPHFRK